MNTKGYSERDEKRILDVFGRSLLKEFPNPDRNGCPGSDVLRRIASREMPLSEAEQWLDHLGSCSPCYREFCEFQAARKRRRTSAILAIAASILIVAGVAGWALFLRQKAPLVAQTSVLDLRNRSVARGTEPNSTEPPPEVSRAAKHWSILLPFGSDDGTYDVRLLTVSGEPLLAARSVAKLTDGVAVIEISVDLSSRRPGKCVLQVSRNGARESYYEVELR